MTTEHLLNKAHQRLRSARNAKGYENAKVFAEKNGLSYSTYSGHESGRNALTERAARKYAELLSVPFAWLYSGDLHNSDDAEKTTYPQLRHMALEPTILPQVLESVLKILGRHDIQINYKNLLKQCQVIVREIIGKNISDEEIETSIATIVGLSKDSLANQIIKDT